MIHRNLGLIFQTFRYVCENLEVSVYLMIARVCIYKAQDSVKVVFIAICVRFGKMCTTAATLHDFKVKLKTYLFSLAFNCD